MVIYISQTKQKKIRKLSCYLDIMLPVSVMFMLNRRQENISLWAVLAVLVPISIVTKLLPLPTIKCGALQTEAAHWSCCHPTWLSATGAAELFYFFIFLAWRGRREGRDNRISDGDWLCNVEWEFVSQSEAVFSLHTNHTGTQQPHIHN